MTPGFSPDIKALSFCTVMDHHYLTRGLALYTSLRRHCPMSALFVLCMDRAASDALDGLALESLRPVPFEMSRTNGYAGRRRVAL